MSDVEAQGEIVREAEVPISRAVCCRTWPVMTFSRLGRCGYCGTVPTVTGPWIKEAP